VCISRPHVGSGWTGNIQHTTEEPLMGKNDTGSAPTMKDKKKNKNQGIAFS
jgi:hypothetical protein